MWLSIVVTTMCCASANGDLDTLQSIQSSPRDVDYSASRSAAVIDETARAKAKRLAVVAESMREKGEMDRARVVLQRALGLAPADANLHSEMGEVLQNNGLLREAQAHLVKAAALEPRNSYIHSTLGHSYLSEANTTGAFQHFAAALRSEPSEDIKYYDLVALWLAEGQHSGGWEAARCLPLDLLTRLEQQEGEHERSADAAGDVAEHGGAGGPRAPPPPLSTAAGYATRLRASGVCSRVPARLRLPALLHEPQASEVPGVQGAAGAAGETERERGLSHKGGLSSLQRTDLVSWVYASLAESLWLSGGDDGGGGGDRDAPGAGASAAAAAATTSTAAVSTAATSTAEVPEASASASERAAEQALVLAAKALELNPVWDM